MKRFVLLICLISTSVFGQIPAGVTPGSVSKDDLDKYGVTEADVQRIMQEYQGGSTPAPAAPAPPEVVVQEASPAEVLPQPMVEPATSTEEEKPVQTVYGKSFFSEKNLAAYESASHLKASPNYVLGVGDEISVSIWGYSEHSGLYKVASDGSISPKLVGKIYLNGVSFEDAEKIISAKFGRVYDLKNSQISIELNYSKVIRVNIVGEVERPGTYSVASINAVFNVLSLAGGITSNGTVRDIQVRRNGKTVSTFDAYLFLQDPSYKSDFFLLEDDYIVVGVKNNIVRISGEVNRPMEYELKPAEGIKELIRFAAGLKPSSYRERMNLYRYQNNRDELIELPYDSLVNSGKNFKLKDGDRIDVLTVPTDVRNRVTIVGPVNLPGEYVFREGMTLKDLVDDADGVKHGAYIEKAFISRVEEDMSTRLLSIDLRAELSGKTKTLLKESDVITLYTKDHFRNSSSIDILGAVKYPSTYPFTSDITLGDLIFMSGGLLPQSSISRIEITRIMNFDRSSDVPVEIQTIRVAVEDNLISEENQKIKLQPYDLVTVRSVPNYRTQELVEITGEAAYPGFYGLTSNRDRVSSLLERAGGLTSWAFVEGAFIERTDTTGVREFIVFDLKKLLKGDEEFDYVMRPGDRIVIPRITNMVSLTGSVDFPKVAEFGVIKMPFEKGHRAKYYVNKYGSGFSDKARRSRTYVESPGGYVKRTRNYGLFKIYPKVGIGDLIVVVEKEEKKKKKKKESDIDWNTAIERTTVKLTAVATLYVILQSAFGSN